MPNLFPALPLSAIHPLVPKPAKIARCLQERVQLTAGRGETPAPTTNGHVSREDGRGQGKGDTCDKEGGVTGDEPNAYNQFQGSG